ncbi:SPFH domain-containing protein [Pseudooceanicola sp. LIPI14-2-Ac024]|uniref:SPFH domain-containing protein n=1 Tax=Pseudooceanicola sp. LIPI14-2-Ac024 TaxID=3344875 RepID=UPI0035D0A92A
MDSGIPNFVFFVIVAIFVVAVLLPSMIVITGQQNVRLIETFGRFSSVRQAGLSFKLPWPIQTATSNFSLRVREIAEDVGVKSSDNAFVVVPIRVQFAVKEGGERDAFYRLDDPDAQIRSYVVNQVRSTASNMTFDDLFRSRDAFETDVERTLAVRMGEFGFKIENVLVDDPQPSVQLREAFDRVIAAQRLKEAATNEGEALRIKSVAAAQAEGESLRIRGEAYAAFRNIIAEGNAEALTKFTDKTGLIEKDALDFFISVNEMEAVTTAAQAGGRVVFVTGSARSGVDKAVLGMVEPDGE